MAAGNITSAAAKELGRIVDQIERLNEEVKALAGDVRDKFDEAKGKGFDVKILRKVLALRKKSREEREEEDLVLSTYLGALGMIDTPLGDWADEQEKGRPIGGGVVATA